MRFSVADPWATLNRYAGAAGADNAGGWDNAAYNDLVAQIGQLSPGDPAVEPLFRQALEIWLKELPVIPMAQRPEPILTNTTYWTGWPTDADGVRDPAGVDHELPQHRPEPEARRVLIPAPRRRTPAHPLVVPSPPLRDRRGCGMLRSMRNGACS